MKYIIKLRLRDHVTATSSGSCARATLNNEVIFEMINATKLFSPLASLWVFVVDYGTY